jgi:hypothetical protein
MSSIGSRTDADRAFPSRRGPGQTRRSAPESFGAISVGAAIIVRRAIQNKVLQGYHSLESGNPGPRDARPSLDARFRRHDTDVSESSPHFERLTRLAMATSPLFGWELDEAGSE